VWDIPSLYYIDRMLELVGPIFIYVQNEGPLTALYIKLLGSISRLVSHESMTIIKLLLGELAIEKLDLYISQVHDICIIIVIVN
jgi:hypothetical protein